MAKEGYQIESSIRTHGSLLKQELKTDTLGRGNVLGINKEKRRCQPALSSFGLYVFFVVAVIH